MPPKPAPKPKMPAKQKGLYGVVAGVVVAGAAAVALLVGGEHTAVPAKIPSPVLGTLYPGMVVQGYSWSKSAGATGYRLYLDGGVIGLVSATRLSTVIAVTCGVSHRFNAQPFNNKGFAALAAPVYVTPPCTGATK